MSHKQKQFLHELLKQDQHPFLLKSYIADKRSRCNHHSRNSCSQSPPINSHRAASLHVPPETAALLAEAAMRISKPNLKTHARFSLFGSFLNILRSKNKATKEKQQSCSCSNRSMPNESFDEDFASRFCSTSVRFSIRRSPSSSGRRTPECCSAAAPNPMKQEKENRGSGEEEEKEQCSPVSILDPFFEDVEIVDEEEEEEEYDLNSSFANIERATQELLNRLLRFEKLAALDPMELELKLLEDSDKKEISEDEGQGSNTLILQHNRRKMMSSSETKRFSCELIVDKKNKTSLSQNMDKHGGIYTMAKLDFRRELEGWEDHMQEEVEEKAAEVEQEIFWVLVQELSDDLLISNRLK